MSTWARSFLDEDNEDMGDKSWFFIKMMEQSRNAGQHTEETMEFNAMKRLLDTDGEARLAAINALSAAAHKGREDEDERRALTPDECWGHDVLKANGICPECLWPAHDGTCEDAADGA